MAAKIRTGDVEARLLEKLAASNVRVIDISGGCGNVSFVSIWPCQPSGFFHGMPRAYRWKRSIYLVDSMYYDLII